MIAATVTLATTGTSLFDLLNAAVAGTGKFSGTDRVCEVQIQAKTGTFHLVYKSGAVVLATDSGFLFQSLAVDTTGTNSRFKFGPFNQNILSLMDIYLAGAAGGETAGIVAYSI